MFVVGPRGYYHVASQGNVCFYNHNGERSPAFSLFEQPRKLFDDTYSVYAVDWRSGDLFSLVSVVETAQAPSRRVIDLLRINQHGQRVARRRVEPGWTVLDMYIDRSSAGGVFVLERYIASDVLYALFWCSDDLRVSSRVQTWRPQIELKIWPSPWALSVSPTAIFVLVKTATDWPWTWGVQVPSALFPSHSSILCQCRFIARREKVSARLTCQKCR